MTETVNLRSSHKYYVQSLAHNRLMKVNQVLKQQGKPVFQLKTVVGKAAVKLIETEKELGITPMVKVEKSEYLRIVTGLMKFIMMKVLSGFDVRLGAKLGMIGIRGSKVVPTIGEDGEVKGLSVSWSKTFKLWNENEQSRLNRVLVYCFNEHSDFIRYKIIWYKHNVILQNKTYYRLVFSRHNKRHLSKLINGGKQYLLLPPKKVY